MPEKEKAISAIFAVLFFKTLYFGNRNVVRGWFAKNSVDRGQTDCRLFHFTCLKNLLYIAGDCSRKFLVGD